MNKDLKISDEDIELTAKFCLELRECFLQYGRDCFFTQLDDSVCKNCLILQFKRELMTSAKPFFEATRKLLVHYLPSADLRHEAVLHLFVGLIAIYSANQKITPQITQSFIDDIERRISKNPKGLLNEITTDLKNLGHEWYEIFYLAWEQFNLPDQGWFNNILLLKIFLEAIRMDGGRKIKNGPKRNVPPGPIEALKSVQEKEELIEEIFKFLKKERKK